MVRQGCLLFCGGILSAAFLAGCASGREQKLQQREKLAASSGLYCDFVNGDKNKEIEIELNLLMARKCDSDKSFSITNYKTSTDVTGMVYCCAVKKDEKRVAVVETSKPVVEKPTPAPIPVQPAKVAPAAPTPAPVKAVEPTPVKAAEPAKPKTDLDEEIPL